MHKVILSACGNIDHGENPYSNIVNGEEVSPQIVECATIQECAQTVLQYIDAHDLGSGNWTGGAVLNAEDKIVGNISYNGRFWPAN